MKFDILKQDSIVVNISRTQSVKLYRIIALREIQNYFGTIPKYAIGGYVQGVENLDPNDESWIKGTARVIGTSFITGNSLIDLDAEIWDSRVEGHSLVTYKATVKQGARLVVDCVLKNHVAVIGNVAIHNSILIGNSIASNGDRGSLLKIMDSNLSNLSYIKGSGAVTRSSLTDGSGILGRNLIIDNCHLSGTALLSKNATNQTLSVNDLNFING